MTMNNFISDIYTCKKHFVYLTCFFSYLDSKLSELEGLGKIVKLT